MAEETSREPYTCSRVIIPAGVTLEEAIAALANQRAATGHELVTSTNVNGEIYLIFKAPAP